MIEAANSNAPPRRVVTGEGRLASDILYQLARAPFGLTVGDLQAYLREDSMGQYSLTSLYLAVDRLVTTGRVEMQRRGELDFVCAAGVGRDTMPAGSQRWPEPAVATGVGLTWDGMPVSSGGSDRSLDAAEGLLLWVCVIIGVLCLVVGGAIVAGWL